MIKLFSQQLLPFRIRWCCCCRSPRHVEANAGWTGDDYTGSVTDIHVGYEGALGTLVLHTTYRWSCDRGC